MRWTALIRELRKDDDADHAVLAAELIKLLVYAGQKVITCKSFDDRGWRGSCGESLAEREPLDEVQDLKIEFDMPAADEGNLAPEPTLMLTVWALPLNMNRSSLASSGCEGLNMSFGTLITSLLASR